MFKRVRIFLFACIAVMFSLTAMHLGHVHSAQLLESRVLRERVSSSTEARSGDGVLHIQVEGTSIDYTVAQANAETGNEFYLSHNTSGGKNRIGCPFIDYRTSATATHVLMYAHGTADTNILFSELKRAYRQDVFDSLGNATLTYPDGSRLSFKPLCALSVDAAYQPIQNFAFAEGELKPWLGSLLKDSSAQTKEAKGSIRKAKRALTLATCTSQLSGQQERTLIVFSAS